MSDPKKNHGHGWTGDVQPTAEQQIKQLQKEIEILRRYGNKDCTAMADEALNSIGEDDD